ncbi:MAG: hypothetical protein A2Z12_03575 [Actinobacteria bacterium RBG_16_68_21]|nr:MAG: hypothetical protein A2Z12_03575 [Actinobacteria bacterium RBG_16_68_21]
MVGYQVAYRIAVDLRPDRIVIASLYADEVDRAVMGLRDLMPDGVEIIGEWGDVFVRDEFARRPRSELLEDPAARAAVFDDLLGPFEAAFARSRLAKLIAAYQPEVVVDAVNTATAISYQDVYTSSILAERDVDALEAGREIPVAVVAHDIDTLILSQSLPQLIRHVLIVNRAMRDAGTRLYLKVGTTGTGGMGLNVPYTHSEDRPSAKLMTKTAVAFAHTGLLFLMDRTPGGPIVKEIKPAALIGYSEVGRRTIRERGKTVALYESHTETLAGTLHLRMDPGRFSWMSDLELPVVDTGENGVFTKGEFEAITSLGQMEFVTPEEIALLCVQEITGINTGRDVVGAVDSSVLGPSYRAGVLRSRVLDELRTLEEATGTHSVALGQLGPPELSKLLWEIELLALGYGTLPAVLAATPGEISETATRLLAERPGLRDTITSLGLPVLHADGRTLDRGPFIRIPEDVGGEPLPVTDAERDAWTAKGWVDLRVENFARWQDRLRKIHSEAPGKSQPGSSGVTPETTVTEAIETGTLAAWVLAEELGGYRIK